jgi:hypothetical protein
VVSMLASGTRVSGFKPGRRIFSGVKILSMPSFGRKVNPWVPCRRLAARQRTLAMTWKLGLRQNLSAIFSPEFFSLSNGGLRARAARGSAEAPRSCSMGAPGVDGGN